jgi:hypothetical protein
MKITALALMLVVCPGANALLGLFKTKADIRIPGDFKGDTMKTPKGPMLPPKVLDNKGLDYIFDNNKAWKASMLQDDKDFFKKLGSTHTPEYMWIGTLLMGTLFYFAHFRSFTHLMHFRLCSARLRRCPCPC